MHRPAALLATLALCLGVPTLAPARAAAEDAPFFQLDEGDHQVGMLSGPAFGSATAFFALQAYETSQERWFDRGWAIAELAGSQAILPMIKADAYGHGAAWAARLLGRMPSLYALGVATLAEGESLRRALGPR